VGERVRNQRRLWVCVVADEKVVKDEEYVVFVRATLYLDA